MKTTLVIIFALMVPGMNAQDPTFNNNNQALVSLNPSFAGSNGGIRNQFSYRNQSPNLSSNYLTLSNTVDLYLKPLRGGLALNVMRDVYAHGVLKVQSINLSYARHIKLGDKSKLIPSVQVGYTSKMLDRSSLTFNDARRGFILTQYEVVPSSRKNYLGFSSGLLFSSNDNFYTGISVFNINQPDEGLLGSSRLHARLVIHSSYNWKISEKNLLQFFARYSDQGNFGELLLAANLLSFKHLVTGISYANRDNAGINVGYRNEFFVLQAGYQMTVSKLAGNTLGSFELHASLNLRKKAARGTINSFESL